MCWRRWAPTLSPPRCRCVVCEGWELASARMLWLLGDLRPVVGLFFNNDAFMHALPSPPQALTFSLALTVQVECMLGRLDDARLARTKWAFVRAVSRAASGPALHAARQPWWRLLLLGDAYPLEGFAPEAQRAFALAEEEARRLGHPTLGPHHLLLGLVWGAAAGGGWLADGCPGMSLLLQGCWGVGGGGACGRLERALFLIAGCRRHWAGVQELRHHPAQRPPAGGGCVWRLGSGGVGSQATAQPGAQHGGGGSGGGPLGQECGGYNGAGARGCTGAWCVRLGRQKRHWLASALFVLQPEAGCCLGGVMPLHRPKFCRAADCHCR